MTKKKLKDLLYWGLGILMYTCCLVAIILATKCAANWVVS